jgi:hypothetical protein
MLGWFQALLPRDERFFELFDRHAQTIVAGADALRRMLEGGEAVDRSNFPDPPVEPDAPRPRLSPWTPW